MTFPDNFSTKESVDNTAGLDEAPMPSLDGINGPRRNTGSRASAIVLSAILALGSACSPEESQVPASCVKTAEIPTEMCDQDGGQVYSSSVDDRVALESGPSLSVRELAEEPHSVLVDIIEAGNKAGNAGSNPGAAEYIRLLDVEKALELKYGMELPERHVVYPLVSVVGDRIFVYRGENLDGIIWMNQRFEFMEDGKWESEKISPRPYFHFDTEKSLKIHELTKPLSFSTEGVEQTNDELRTKSYEELSVLLKAAWDEKHRGKQLNIELEFERRYGLNFESNHFVPPTIYLEDGLIKVWRQPSDTSNNYHYIFYPDGKWEKIIKSPNNKDLISTETGKINSSK